MDHIISSIDDAVSFGDLICILLSCIIAANSPADALQIVKTGAHVTADL